MSSTFRSVTDQEQWKSWGLSSKICDIHDFRLYVRELSEKSVLAYGQLLTLFGEPAYLSENYEEQYEYYILATDEQGDSYQLTAYSGPSGPSIGGDDRDKRVTEAANALAAYIREAEASDYAYQGYYMDSESKISCGVKDHKAYYQEEHLELSEKEFSALYRRLYHLN